MTIIKIGNEYVNLENIVSISVDYNKVCIRTQNSHYEIKSRNTIQIRDMLDTLSERAKKLVEGLNKC